MEKFIYSSIKIFLWIIIGGLLKFVIKKINVDILKKIIKISADIIVWFIIPYFIFIKIWLYGIKPEIFLPTLTLFLIIMLITYFISSYLLKKFDISIQESYLPLTFMNTLYLGIPVTEYFISKGAVYYTIVYAIIAAIMQFTVGVYILSPNLSFINIIISSPMVYMSALGWILNISNIHMPQIFILINDSLSKILSPLMLLFIGYAIPWKSFFNDIRLHLGLNIVRIFFLFVTSIIFTLILKQIVIVNEEFMKVLIIISILPSAIANYILLEKYNIDTKFTIGEIFWGTVVVLFFLPYLVQLLEILLLIIY